MQEDAVVWVGLRRRCVGLFIFFIIFQLFAVLIVTMRILGNYIPMVTGVFNGLFRQ